MPLNRRRYCLGMAAGLCGTAQGQAAAVQIAVDSQNPPFMYQAKGEGVPRGVYPVLLRAVFKQLGEPLQLLPMPWARALGGLDRAEHGVGGLYANRERLAKFDYGQPILTETVRVYAQRGRLKQFNGLDDLRGLRVGVLRGWSYGDEFDAARKAGQLKVEDVTDDRANFGKLERDFLDVVLSVEQTGEQVMASGEFPSVRVMPNPLTENPAYVAFHKSRQQQGLLARIDEVVAQLRRSGEHARLVAQGLKD
ncbi:substrate-binding periplasmic protein [Inhella sp.]|uniref:substrate-binding periplasmic protein n=1 Tax=Inhella sp. TaxID=1921806 RepID=UPI0035AEA38B